MNSWSAFFSSQSGRKLAFNLRTVYFWSLAMPRTVGEQRRFPLLNDAMHYLSIEGLACLATPSPSPLPPPPNVIWVKRQAEGDQAESIEWTIEDQAFSQPYDLTPNPPPLPSASCLSFSVFLCVAGPAYRRQWGGGWRGLGMVLYK
jgi:hypothetical protein